LSQISRKELKSDEFVSGMDAALEFFLQHRDRIITLAVIVVVVAAAGYGYYAWNANRNQKAEALLAVGVNTLHAPLTPATAGSAGYADAAARAQAAVAQLQKVVDQYGSSSAGQMARYYMGLAQLDLKTPDAAKQAQANLEQASNSGDAAVATAAKHALANLALQQGNLAKAHELLLALTHQDSPTLPRAVALMELADLDRTYNPKEAAQLYQQLQTEYPSTATAEQAKQQLASLHQ
jgi:TolA-binding protein